MIDNYDSFTFNVVQYLMELGEDVSVWRNDEISVDAIIEATEKIVISPGPCTPNEAGISLEVIERLAEHTNIRHLPRPPSIGQAFGGHIIEAPKVMHGKLSAILLVGWVFEGLPSYKRPAIIPW